MTRRKNHSCAGVARHPHPLRKTQGGGIAGSNDAWQRYDRQMSLPGFGRDGQRRLARGSAIVLGLGAVGSIAAVYLARAGVGRLGIADFDTVEISNLHRQVFFNEADVGCPKVTVLVSVLRRANAKLIVEPYKIKVNSTFLRRTVSHYDVVIDCIDNFEDKLAVNEIAWSDGIPLVFAGVQEYVGQVLTIVAGKGPCLQCLLGDVPTQQAFPNQVFPPVAGAVGCIQAAEAIKLLLQVGTPLIGRMLLVNSADWTTNVVPVGRRIGCRICDSRQATTASD